MASRRRTPKQAPRVLVVDDDALEREALAAMLEDYEVTSASTAREAIDVLSRQDVDVLCTDYQMPGMNGIELLRKVEELSPATVGVLVTGFPEYMSDAGRSGDVKYLLLVKPFTPEKLHQVMEQAIRFGKIRGYAREGARDAEGGLA